MTLRKYANSEYYIFIFIVSLYFIPKYLEYTTFSNIILISKCISILKPISYILAISWFCLKIINKRKLSMIFTLIVIPILFYFTYEACIKKQNSIFVLLLFSLIYDSKFYEKYISYILKISIILYVFTVLCSKIGLIENVITTRNKFGEIWQAGGNGFGYSGQMMMMTIPIVFLYYLKNDNNVKIYQSVLIFFFSLVIYLNCKTIMGFALICLFIVLYHILKFNNKLKKHLIKSNVVKICPVIFSIIIISLVYAYTNGVGFTRNIDSILNGRLSVPSRVIDKYGIHILGSSFVNNMLNGNYEILDSEYLQILISGGVVYFLISIFLMCLIMNYTQRNSITLSLVWFLIFLNAMVNNGVFGIVMNPLSILILPSFNLSLKIKNTN